MRKIAIGDVHGCLRTLRSLVEEGIGLNKEDELFLLGDYIDRGPNSKGVLDYLFKLQDQGYQLRCLRGNHEEMMLQARLNESEVSMWLYNGGRETLASFGVEKVELIPEKYFDFIRKLDHFIETDRYILVHAGLNFVGDPTAASDNPFLWRLHNPLTDYRSMLWIRWWYEDIDRKWLRDRVIVHGHTPVLLTEIKEMYEDLEERQVLDIDNGCFARGQQGLGHLCAFDMTNEELLFQKNID